jgi:uncharacterized protein (DUF849 family)
VEKVIVTVALVGGITTREKNPNVPMTPKEIAESAIESYHAGAAICHVHVRDPETHEPSSKFELYQEVVERIREKCDMIVNLSTGFGGRLGYDSGAKGHPWDTLQLKSPEERVEHVVKLKPELCSLDVGTLNFGQRAFVNLVSIVEKMATMIKEVGTKPELEIFDIGNIRIANHLVSKGLVEKPPLFQLCLGIPWGIEATVGTWSICGTTYPEMLFGMPLALAPIISRWRLLPCSWEAIFALDLKIIFTSEKIPWPRATLRWSLR